MNSNTPALITFDFGNGTKKEYLISANTIINWNNVLPNYYLVTASIMNGFKLSAAAILKGN